MHEFNQNTCIYSIDTRTEINVQTSKLWEKVLTLKIFICINIYILPIIGLLSKKSFTDMFCACTYPIGVEIELSIYGYYLRIYIFNNLCLLDILI